MPTLYEITEDMRALDDLLEQAGGDITDESVAQAIEEWVTQLDSDLHRKVDGYAAYIQELLAIAEARRAEARRLNDSAMARLNAAKRLKERLMLAMQERDIKKIETPRFTVTWQKNGGKTPIDVQVPAEELPAEYQRIEYLPAKDSIRNALEQGIEIDGCALMDRGASLRIK